MRFHGLAVAALALGGATGGTLAGADGAIHACAHPKEGLRIVDSPQECRKYEQPLSWNVQGPTGEPGAQLASIADLNGLACSSGTVSGTVSVSVTSTGEVTLTCSLPAPELRVNEVMTGTSGAAANEFVEIVNAGSAPADLSGYRLVYRSATGTTDVTLATMPSGTSLAAGARYV